MISPELERSLRRLRRVVASKSRDGRRFINRAARDRVKRTSAARRARRERGKQQ